LEVIRASPGDKIIYFKPVLKSELVLINQLNHHCEKLILLLQAVAVLGFRRFFQGLRNPGRYSRGARYKTALR